MWEYRAKVLKVNDGDTLTLLIDQGFSSRQEEAIRLADVSAPELNEPGGYYSLMFTQDWIGRLRYYANWPILVRTQPNSNPEPTERRSFVRYIGTIVSMAEPDLCLNADLRTYLAEHPEWGSGQ